MRMLIDGCRDEQDARYRNSGDSGFVWPNPVFSVLNYVREPHRTPGVADLTDINAIKRVYFAIPQTNPEGIVPRGPAEVHLDESRDRARLRAANQR